MAQVTESGDTGHLDPVFLHATGLTAAEPLEGRGSAVELKHRDAPFPESQFTGGTGLKLS
jgi:hypothetical protein